MNKQIQLMRDYHTSPIWKVGGAEAWGSVDNSLGDIPVDGLPISDQLKDELNKWQAVADNYFAVMEKIPGGGWSHHTPEEFETARKALNLPVFPSKEEDEKAAIEIWKKLKTELNDKGYDVYLHSSTLAI